ncbi:MAG: hypothetical protein IT204_22860 [Fimbriimonadaceae bacterium]|nr:hypothetical protein [Fimbriimonadaceae bacterium]
MSSLILLTLLLAPAWTVVGPGGGGWIQALAYSPHHAETLYAGCDVGGFYRSDDGGATWRILNHGLRCRWVECILPHPTNPQRLWIGTESGVHRSDDGGATWRLLRNGFPPSSTSSYTAPIASLAVDPANPDIVYAGLGRPRLFKGGSGALYRSTDAGEHWERWAQPGALPADAILADLLWLPDDTLLTATQHGPYASADRGRTWAARATGLPHPRVRRLAASSDGALLYLTLFSSPGQVPFDGGVYRSRDAGQHWEPALRGLPNWVREGHTERNLTCQYDRLVVDPTAPQTLYVGGAAWVNAAVFRSDDAGTTWRDVLRRATKEQPGNVDLGYLTFWGPSVTCLAIHPRQPQRLMSGSSGHLLETRDGGGRWEPRFTRRAGEGWNGHGLEVTCIWTAACHPTRAGEWLLGYMDIGLWRTTDAGASLQRGMAGVPSDHSNVGTALVYDPAAPDTVYAGCGQWGSNRGGLYLSHDAGQRWTAQAGLPDARVEHLLVDPASPPDARRLYVAQSGQPVVVGNSAGWQPLPPLPGPLAGLAWQGTTVLALTTAAQATHGGLYALQPDGAGWERRDTTPFVASARQLAVSPADPRCVWVTTRQEWVGTQLRPGGAWVSRDGGRTFRQVFENHFIEALAPHPTDPNVAAIGGTDHPFHDEPLGCGVHLTRDGGATWTDLTSDLPAPNVKVLRWDPTDPTRLLAGTGGNSLAWRRVP